MMAGSDVVNRTIEAIPPKLKTASKGPRRVSRLRSKIACRQCRHRKVRCDVYPGGAPCTNCRLDDIGCTLNERKRSYATGKPRKNQSTTNPYGTMGSPTYNLGGFLASSCKAKQVAPFTCPPDIRFFDNRQLPISIPDERTPGMDLDWLEARNISAASTSSDKSPTTATIPNAVLPRDMPSYIHFDPSHTSNTDLSYLQDKGCFNIPKKDILDDLLRCYFDYVHPRVPFLDEEEFLEAYLNRGARSSDFDRTGSHISLLLFQAVVFAATTCASLSVLRRAGYSSRRAARQDMFYRVRALYSLDVEKDRMVLLQTLLLMSFWRGVSSEDKDAWHWSGLAISVAIELGLHDQRSTQLTERQKTLRRRCWWSCVLRDRLLALSDQRAPRVQFDLEHVPLLTLADYNVGLRSAISELSPEEELGKRTALSIFSLQLIRLVLCIGRERQPRSSNLNRFSPAAVEVWARTQLETYDDESMTGLADLDFWRLNLPEVLQRSPDSAGDDTVLPCILVHRNSLQIYYHKLILSICVPRMLNAVSQTEVGHDSRLAHASSVTLAKLYNELVDFDSIHCLPSECFGYSTCLEQVNLQTASRCEPTREDDTHVARVYTSIITGSGFVHRTSMDRAICEPLAWGGSSGYKTQSTQNTDLMNAMTSDGCHQMLEFDQDGTVSQNNLDAAVNFFSDTLWTLDDGKSCDDISSSLPDLEAGDLGTSISGTNAPAP